MSSFLLEDSVSVKHQNINVSLFSVLFKKREKYQCGEIKL